MTNKENLV